MIPNNPKECLNASLHETKQRPFEKIKSGSKTIEMRLFDEKRQRISVGDFIEFSSADNLPKKYRHE